MNVCGLASITGFRRSLLSRPGPSILPGDVDATHLRQPVDYHEPRIVRRAGVLFARIAQPHNRNMAAGYFFFGLVSAGASPSSSFLPFLMTSGSAAAPPSAVGAASTTAAAGATSSARIATRER